MTEIELKERRERLAAVGASQEQMARQTLGDGGAVGTETPFRLVIEHETDAGQLLPAVSRPIAVDQIAAEVAALDPDWIEDDSIPGGRRRIAKIGVECGCASPEQMAATLSH